MRIILALGAALAVTACAGTGAPSIYDRELQTLRAQCEARNGTLLPAGSPTGNVATDYVCRIRDGGSNISPAA